MKTDEDLIWLFVLMLFLVPITLALSVLFPITAKESFSIAAPLVYGIPILNFVLRRRWTHSEIWMKAHMYVCLVLSGIGVGYWVVVGISRLLG